MTVVRAAARQLSDQLAQIYTAPAPTEVVIEDFTIAADPDRRLRVRRYRPSAAEGALPTQIWMHGGGFAFGEVDELVNDRLCASRTAATGVQTLSVEYRLAPENAYPAPIDDVLAVFDAAIEDQRLSVDAERIGIGGNSAGATIAASSALRIRDTRTAPLVHQLLEVPLVIFEPFGDSMREFDLDEGPVAVAPKDITGAGEAYLSAGVPDQYAVPLEADVAGLPPTVIMTAEFDPLRDGGEAYAERLRSAGVRVTAVRGDGQLHGTCSLTAAWEASRRWQSTVAQAMVEAYRSEGGVVG
ncbi:lipolytic protein [Microlunatus endophyticus]|uniref:Lipolytic protein n=1 Tax=Microlunatus endophyticus TaxID=1716077 RepID=A0A917SAW4_9ACTN|nr:alpha/beta hydrolase [Microlunatus endophyticus]GGL66333.1 lipolytic protein [Microlunatus endophyticus]